MKLKVKNKKTNVVKEIDSNLLGDYLATKEWEKVDEPKEKKEEKPSFRASSNSGE